MPLDKLVGRILSDAREYADDMVNDAKARRLETLLEADADAQKEYAVLLEEARRVAELEKRQRVTAALLEARSDLLKEKLRIIQEVIDGAVKAITSQPQAEYTRTLLRVLLGVMGEESMDLILSAYDRERLGEELEAQANEALERSGKACRVGLLDETRDISGGFILRSQDIEINCSIDAQIEAQREEIEERLIELLFSDIAEIGSGQEKLT